jgi:glyoxylase-like metal-dependent hydrolase (beta-lactamase superfamily II)
MQPEIRSFFHKPTFTYSYVVSDPATREAAVIDPVLDFDVRSGRLGTASVAAIDGCLRDDGLALRYVLETHAHADHLSGAQFLAQRGSAVVAIGVGICDVQAAFKSALNLESNFCTDGRQFDRLLHDGERLPLGGLDIAVLAMPGHTSDSVAYLVGDALFVGDSLFMPDYGTARCDFPGGDARMLFRSIQRLYALDLQTRLFMCHDYAPGGRAYQNQSTIAAERAGNIHVRDGVTEDEFVALRTARDLTLDAPQLLYPAIQVNVRAGVLPPAEGNGRRYLRIPLSGP